MVTYRLTLAALAMATLSLASPVTANDSCHPAAAPFPGATCRTVTKPDGTETTIYLSGLFTPGSPSESTGRCNADKTIFSGKSTNPEAPLASDCEALRVWLDENPGTFAVEPRVGEWMPLASLDTCGFVAKPVLDNVEVFMASDDMARLVEESLEKRVIDGRLDVLGRTVCEISSVDWRISGIKSD
jgi:hypothetical protein